MDTDGDGVREDGEGNEIEFSMVTNTGNSVRAAVGEIIHEGMAQIGLRVEFRLIEFGELVDQLTETFDWEAVVIGLTGGPDPHSGITTLAQQREPAPLVSESARACNRVGS